MLQLLWTRPSPIHPDTAPHMTSSLDCLGIIAPRIYKMLTHSWWSMEQKEPIAFAILLLQLETVDTAIQSMASLHLYLIFISFLWVLRFNHQSPMLKYNFTKYSLLKNSFKKAFLFYLIWDCRYFKLNYN